MSHSHQTTSWAEREFDGLAGVKLARIPISDDPAAPVVWRAVFPPGVVVSPHTHACDYMEIILEGTQEVTRKTYVAGDIRIVKGGTVYGPLVAGPEGVTVLVIMASGNDASLPPRPGAAMTVGGISIEHMQIKSER